MSKGGCSCRIEKSYPRGRNFNQGLGEASSLVEISTPWVRFPYYDGFLYSYSR